jgi:hypothetical protein
VKGPLSERPNGVIGHLTPMRKVSAKTDSNGRGDHVFSFELNASWSNSIGCRPDYMSQGFVISPVSSVSVEPFQWRKTMPFSQTGK